MTPIVISCISLFVSLVALGVSVSTSRRQKADFRCLKTHYFELRHDFNKLKTESSKNLEKVEQHAK